MKVNWKVRFKNPVWVAQAVAAIFLPILAYYGLNWSDMTSWTAIGSVLLKAISNPVVVVAAVVGVWNNILDPTTKGLSDSEKALTYEDPR